MKLAIVCRQGAVRSQYIAARLREGGFDALAYGAKPNVLPVYPLMVGRASLRGVNLFDPERHDVTDAPDDAIMYLLDERYAAQLPQAKLIPVRELDLSGMTPGEAIEAIDAIDDYLGEMDYVAEWIAEELRGCP